MQSSSVLGIWDVKGRVAPSSHLAFDLLDLSVLCGGSFRQYNKSSFLIYLSIASMGSIRPRELFSGRDAPERIGAANLR